MEKVKYIFSFNTFSLLQNKPENIVLNTFINGTIKTYAILISSQCLFYLHWKRNFSSSRAINFLMYKHIFIIPFIILWYKFLKASLYQLVSKSKYTPKQEVNRILNNIDNLISLNKIETDDSLSKELKDKIKLSYILK